MPENEERAWRLGFWAGTCIAWAAFSALIINKRAQRKRRRKAAAA
jgi:hypothetical protein